jgi:hydrogenase maturation protease
MTMTEKSQVLLFGIGNCGRADDGLGWAFLDKMKSQLPENYDYEYRYQLQIEDADLASQYDTVIFIDAHKHFFEDGFNYKRCFSKATNSFTTHELDPTTVLYLTESIFGKKPQAYILGINGEKYSLDMCLSDAAEQNLLKAISFFKEEILLQTVNV